LGYSGSSGNPEEKAMNKLVAVTPILLIAAAAANASILFDNGAPIGDTSRCDTSLPACGPDQVTIADEFTLSSAAMITGFTYYDRNTSSGVYAGDVKWAIWNGDPLRGGSVIADGDNSGAFTMEGEYGRVAVTGLNESVAAGDYWLAIETQLSSGTTWSRAYATAGAGTFELWGNAPTDASGFNTYLSGKTAFSVEGNVVTPEPSSVIMIGLGIAALAVKCFRQPS
jgi:hypothetical protein